MRRRDLVGAIGLAAVWPAAVLAQQPAKVLRVGSASAVPRTFSFTAAFEARMAELGHREGVNFLFDFIQVASVDSYLAAYRGMAVRGVDIFLAGGNESAIRAARAAAPQAPVVFVAIDYDPLAGGWVASLARPGGLATGLFLQQIELTIKRLDLLKVAFPQTISAIMFWDKVSAEQWQTAQGAAAGLGLQLTGVELRDPPYDYEAALSQAPPAARETLIVAASPFFNNDRARLAELALRHRLVSVFPYREHVDRGGLFSYGASLASMSRRAADYVDRIARGAKPADLPVEQPTVFELVINLDTARKIGLEIPVSLLARADEVIE